MIHMYPTTQKIFASAIALCLFAIVNAQGNDYATLEQKIVSARYTVTNKQPETSPVVKIKARTADKVSINWAQVKTGVSHYVIERSTNGYNFYEAGIMFTGESETEPEYTFTDNLRVNFNGPLYYRLRVVGLDESETITPVTIMKRGGGASLLTH